MSPPYTDAWVDGLLSTKFYTRTYAATTPAIAHVVFVHGFAEHVGRYEQTFPVYASKGISVFAYDQRGFGRTACDNANKSPASSWGVTSWKSQQDDIAFFILRERERLGPELPIFLMGHSMVRELDHSKTFRPPLTFAFLSLSYCNPQCLNLGRR
jgi:acylglycerol lipase